jgi:hypothetical protein
MIRYGSAIYQLPGISSGDGCWVENIPSGVWIIGVALDDVAQGRGRRPTSCRWLTQRVCPITPDGRDAVMARTPHCPALGCTCQAHDTCTRGPPRVPPKRPQEPTLRHPPTSGVFLSSPARLSRLRHPDCLLLPIEGLDETCRHHISMHSPQKRRRQRRC